MVKRISLGIFYETLAMCRKNLIVGTDFTGPSLFVNSPIWSDYAGLLKRGIRLRFITEITKENMKYCEKLLKVCELRHLEKVKGNFGIIDGKSYGAGSSAAERAASDTAYSEQYQSIRGATAVFF